MSLIKVMGDIMKIDKDKIHDYAAKVYDITVNGSLPGSDSAYELAAKYNKMPLNVEQRIDKLIKSHVVLGASSGFLSGFGGFAVMAVTLPLNLASVMFVQIRLITAIAIICGCDPQDKRVKTFVMACLVGEGAVDLIKSFMINTAKSSAGRLVGALNKLALRQIQEKALRQVIERLSKRLAPRIIRVVPLLGGVVGGAVDGLAVAACGQAAKKVFLDVYIGRYLETQIVEDTEYGSVKIAI